MRVTRWRHRATPTSEGDPTGRRPARQGLQVSLRPENGKIIPSMPEQQPPGRLGMCAEGPFWAGFGPAGLPARSGLPSESISRFRCRRLAVNGAKRPRIQMIEFRENLERAKGFEPSTPTLARLCSTPELRPPLTRRPIREISRETQACPDPEMPGSMYDPGGTGRAFWPPRAGRRDSSIPSAIHTRGQPPGRLSSR